MPWPEITRRSALLASASSMSIMPSAASSMPTPSTSAHFSLKTARRLLDIELDLAAEEIVGIEPAKNGVAIGDRRLGAAAVEADRAGIGAGAFRPEADLLGQRIDLQDHAGAGADRVEMQRRHVELEAVHERLVLDPRLAAGDHPHVKARAAHVGADQRVIADQLADIGRAQNAADRAGDHGLVQARMVDRGQSAEGEQRLHAVSEAIFLRDVLDALKLLAAARRGIGLDQHAVQPRLLADDRPHLVAGVDRDVGAGLFDLGAARSPQCAFHAPD